MRSCRYSRNLLPSKRKNHPARWFFEGSLTGKFLNRGSWLVEEHSHQTCSVSLASTGLKHQDSTPLISYQWLPPVAIRRVFPGWIQVLSYRNRRGSRTKRGVRADSPAWSEPPVRNPVAREGMRKRHHAVRNGGMQRVNLTVGTGERTREPSGGKAWYL